ncbi:MAG: putative metal-dependent hydrolase [Saprospiraceae bacterium]|nr:putative metal-dependent hydrolase [Saprospiraceae bacterium]
MLNEIELEQLRYPIGRYQRLSVIDETQIQEWKNDIAALPMLLKSAVAELTEANIEIPYRAGGWNVRQITHHLADSHINAYVRFKLALTEENPTIKPYLQDRWSDLQDAQHAPLAWSLMLLEGVHQRWGMVLDTMRLEDYQRTFVHPEFKEALRLDFTLGLYAWHGKHHLTQIVNFKERYGV